jgi:hypothetical protein
LLCGWFGAVFGARTAEAVKQAFRRPLVWLRGRWFVGTPGKFLAQTIEKTCGRWLPRGLRWLSSLGWSVHRCIGFELRILRFRRG